ncbi:ATP-dependent permease [Vermiconidia calcicola]|uniref:ATP-dependent permease n=1 Tax=Vermiconidia calcicola TaxID=1690605 RepID=A0ACC3MR31_9PEZI|nr:ATP-dependent permease [Vermiconidia calcicola]
MPSATRQDDLRHERHKSTAGSEAVSQVATDKSTESPPAPWRALFFFTTRSNIPILIAGITFSILAGATSPAQSYIMGKVFGGFTSFATGTLEKEEFFRKEKTYIFYLLAVSGGAWLFNFLEMTAWLAFGELQGKSARDRLFHGLLKKDIEWYDLRKNGIGALLPRIQAQIRELQLSTSQPLGFLFNLSATALLSLIQALVRSWDLTLVSIASTPLIMFAVIWVGKGIQRNYLRQQDKLTEAQKFSSSALTAIETVKCFNGQEIEQEKYAKCVTEAAGFYYRVAAANAIQMSLIVLLSVSMFVQGFYYGGVLIREGKKSTADVLTTFLSAVAAFQALNSIVPQLLFLEKGRIAGATLRAVMSQMQQGLNVQTGRGNLRPGGCRGDIDVKNVTFAYPSQPHQLAINNVTLFIPGGEMTFLIGKSGSGKSTLGQLLLRFYSSYQGSISLDGTALESLDRNWLRSNITLVEQTSLLFNDTVLHNIAFGKRDHTKVSKREVMEAAEFALLQVMINDLPNGLETMVGYKGGSMSGGQRQRMALARARLRDTPILLLDESTSALDQISRALMLDAIRQWRRGKTTIVITHDISQILPDDYVYVLAQGRLVQEGYRKHMEKVKDTPFQGFLPPEQRATTSPYDSRKHTAFESVRTRGSSLDSIDQRYCGMSNDPLETQLNVSDNKRASVMMNIFKEGSRYAGVRKRAFASPWMRLAGPSPPSTSPGAPSANRWSGLWGKDEKPSPAAQEAERKRFSKAMENLVDTAGRLAAESRMNATAAGRTRAKIIDTESMSTVGEGGAIYPKSTRSVGDEGADTVVQKPFKEIMSTLWPIIDWRTRLILIAGFYGATIHALGSPIFAFVLSKLMQTYAIPGGDKQKSLVYSMIILGLAIVDAAHTYIDRFCLEYVGQRWVNLIRAEAMKRILDQPRAFFDREENAVSRLTGSLDRNAEEMRNLLGRFSGIIWTAAIMCVVAVVWAMAAQWKMTLISLAAAPYIFGVTRAYAAVSDKWENLSNTASEDAASIFTETFTNIKTVRALTLEQHFLDKYVEATNKALNVGFRRSLFSGFFYGLSDSAGNFAIAMVFYVGATLVKSGTPVQAVVQVFTMLIFTITNLGFILEYIPQIGSAKDTASRLLRLAELPDDSHEHLGDTRITTVGDIMFDDLQFSYPSRPEQTILNHVKLHIQPGTTTAIVGGSGSGKSTIANLLLNLYGTTTAPGDGYRRPGDLTLAGRDIKRIHTPSLRSLVTPVSQTPTLFSATVAENIGYGLQLSSPNNWMDAISDAAKQAAIHEFITSLPQGYSTPVGDGGMGISGGQAQRIAIARALARKPAVLILDEATSALDVESANLVRHTIETLVRDRSQAMTVIIITHSRDMMEIAEHIVVLDKGRIVEEGGLQELLVKNGALTNLLSSGEWDDTRQQAVARPRGVPLMKEVDWRRRRRKERPRQR